jgi:hypothetical protein
MMALISRSPTGIANEMLKQEPAKPGETNTQWLRRLRNQDGVILIGGTSVSAFRVRVAQSSLRSDMLPSYWSLCGILLKGEVFASAPLNTGNDISAIPKSNAVKMCRLKDYDDPQRYPNVAVVRFAKIHDTVHQDIQRLKTDRSILDLTALMLPWLGFVWGTGAAHNPLLNGTGLPSAAFVETIFAMAGFELTPGLSSASSCPEAIWQSAKWWADFYQKRSEPSVPIGGKATKGAPTEREQPKALAMVPTGFFVIRQPAAAIVE